MIPKLRKIFQLPIGYSDHTLGIEVSLAAVSVGAKIIEKHFTLDKKLKGPDHKASLNIDELNSLVKSIRNIEKSFGVEEKKITKSEKRNMRYVRKFIVARQKIKKGEKFSTENLTTKKIWGWLITNVMEEFVGEKIKI